MPKPPHNQRGKFKRTTQTSTTSAVTAKRQSRFSQVVAGNLFSLFWGLVIGMLQFFGIIPVIAGYCCTILAGVVGTLLIYSNIVPLRKSHHKTVGATFLWVILLAIGFAAWRKNNHDQGKQSISSTSSSVALSSTDNRDGTYFVNNPDKCPVGSIHIINTTSFANAKGGYHFGCGIKACVINST